MGDVIDLDQARAERISWITGWAQCSVCGHTWIATCPEDYDGQGLDCSRGHRRAGLFPVELPQGEG